MKLQATWTAGGVEHTATTRPIDVIMWERKSGSKITAAGGLAMEDMLWMVWHAGTRDGSTGGLDFDGWLATVEDWEPRTVNPTRPAEGPSAG